MYIHKLNAPLFIIIPWKIKDFCSFEGIFKKHFLDKNHKNVFSLKKTFFNLNKKTFFATLLDSREKRN